MLFQLSSCLEADHDFSDLTSLHPRELLKDFQEALGIPLLRREYQNSDGQSTTKEMIDERCKSHTK